MFKFIIILFCMILVETFISNSDSLSPSGNIRYAKDWDLWAESITRFPHYPIVKFLKTHYIVPKSENIIFTSCLQYGKSLRSAAKYWTLLFSLYIYRWCRWHSRFETRSRVIDFVCVLSFITLSKYYRSFIYGIRILRRKNMGATFTTYLLE